MACNLTRRALDTLKSIAVGEYVPPEERQKAVEPVAEEESVAATDEATETEGEAQSDEVEQVLGENESVENTSNEAEAKSD